MSCAYWPPKSSTRINEGPSGTPGVESREQGMVVLSTACYSLLPSHPDLLGALLELAFRVQRGSVHDLGLLELLDVLVAGRRHAHPEGAHQVQGPVVLVGGTDEYLLQRPGGPGADAGTAREGGVEGGHAPRVASPRRLLGLGEGAAQHDGVAPARYGPPHVPSGAHPAVGDYVDVLAGLEKVAHPRRGGVGDGGRLRHPDPDHPSGRADTPGTHADQNPYCPGPHQVQRRRVARAPPDHHGHVQRRPELHEVERLHGSRYVLGGDDRPLDDEHVEARLYGGPVVALDPLGGEARRGYDALVLYLLDAAEDQLLFDGLGVDLLHHPRRLGLGQARYLLEDRPGVLVARLKTLEVEHGQAP